MTCDNTIQRVCELLGLAVLLVPDTVGFKHVALGRTVNGCDIPFSPWFPSNLELDAFCRRNLPKAIKLRVLSHKRLPIVWWRKNGDMGGCNA